MLVVEMAGMVAAVSDDSPVNLMLANVLSRSIAVP